MQPEVSQFILVAPRDRRDEVARSSERLSAHLAHAFPGYKFRIEQDGPFSKKDVFTIIPIMSGDGPKRTDDGFILCRQPDAGLMQDIAFALRDFEFDEPSRLN